MQDSDGFVRCFSVQHRSVVEKLERGDVHCQPWLRSAAYMGTPCDPDGRCHRRGYLWMASQYAKRMGCRLRTAPVWVSFASSKAFCSVKDFEVEVVLELTIPRSELLISQYFRPPSDNWERVLANSSFLAHACFDSLDRISKRRAKRATWERLFILSDDPSDWQGVVDRFEPRWLVRRLSVPACTSDDEC